MILSEKHRNRTLQEIQKFKDALLTIDNADFDEEWHREVQMSAIQSEIETLQEQVAEYDMLRSGGITFAKCFSIECLPDVLVQARIASGMSQTDLASRLNLKPQQIQRYEASNYLGASLARLTEISQALGVRVEGSYHNKLEERGRLLSWSRPSEISWERFPIEEMLKRDWLVVERDETEVQATKRYVESACETLSLSAALHRKKVRGDATIDEYSLLAWQARVLQRANSMIQDMNIPEFVPDDRWIPSLKTLTREANGPREAVEVLAENGIVLVIEERLEGIHVDGGAMLNVNGSPVIGLTLRHDCLDNFWYVLFHELGHVFLHLVSGHRYDFFDDERASLKDDYERDAETFAFDNLIAPDDWAKCTSPLALSIDTVQIDAARLNVGPSIVAGRLRRERKNDSLFAELVGQDEVRVQFDS